MVNLSKFSETLNSFMFENNMSIAQTAKAIGVDDTCILRYLLKQRTPTLENVIKLADLFNCSTDYLLGREAENYPAVFVPIPPFSEQLLILQKRFDCPWQKFYKICAVSPSRFYEWKNGKRSPTLNCMIALADGFDVTLDSIIGRTRS